MKKELYFTRETIKTRGVRWMKEHSLRHKKHDNFPFSPKTSALIVLDMQRFFLDKSSHAYIPSARAILPKLSALITAFHNIGSPVIFTRHGADNSPLTMKEWWDDNLKYNEPRSELSCDIDISGGLVMKKSTYDAFLDTELEELLRKYCIDQVVICGVMTHLCCETTARSAFNRGFFVFFPVDGTATYTREYHVSTLRNLAHGFAVPVTMDELLEACPK